MCAKGGLQGGLGWYKTMQNSGLNRRKLSCRARFEPHKVCTFGLEMALFGLFLRRTRNFHHLRLRGKKEIKRMPQRRSARKRV